MLPRFNHLMVPLDFTEKNQAALDIAFEIAVLNHSRITLLHVVEKIEDADSDEDIQLFYERLSARARDELELRAQPFAAAKLQVDFKTRIGKRAIEICEDAKAREVDLIVMSSHPIDPHNLAQSVGTLSYQVSLLCSSAILLVK